MRIFGLLGKKLGHSFSKKYFTEKFIKEDINNCEYKLFEIPNISNFPEILKTYNPSGLNVTIPYKQDVIPFLDECDDSARRIGAVNVIKIGKKLIGFNSDYFGFRDSLLNWLHPTSHKALILGTGGASLAVKTVLEDLEIPYLLVSRKNPSGISYDTINRFPEIIKEHNLIINTTPLGMFPDISECPSLPYQMLNSKHFLYDLVYNPEETVFMKKGLNVGAKVKNGLEMLQLQAEKSWEIWNS